MALSSKNRLLVAGALMGLAFLLSQCNDAPKKEMVAAVKDSTSCAKPLNPNGDSELALLMRKMMSSSKNLKEMVEKGEVPTAFPEEFLKIHTAKPTDSDTKKASFEGYASNYVSSLKALYNSPKEELGKNYNAVVEACVMCHQEHCPGPLKAINKLKI